MTQRYRVASGLSVVAILSPAHAFACGDPAVIYLVAAIIMFQVMLLAVIFSARRTALQDRFKFSGLYLASVILIWILSSVFIHGWFDKPRNNVF